jgi:hypothetical protein
VHVALFDHLRIVPARLRLLLGQRATAAAVRRDWPYAFTIASSTPPHPSETVGGGASGCPRCLSVSETSARWALHDPRQDFRRQRLRDMGGASRGLLDDEPLDAFGLIGVDPALQRTPAKPQILGNLAMASPRAAIRISWQRSRRRRSGVV